MLGMFVLIVADTHTNYLKEVINEETKKMQDRKGSSGAMFNFRQVNIIWQRILVE